MKLGKIILAAGFLACSLSVAAKDVRIAVAANFTAPMKELAPIFEKKTGDRLVISYGATGAFYAQIKNGAPFDVLLAADDSTPSKIEQEGLGEKGSSFTYAVGKLVLWSSNPNYVDSSDVLKKDSVKYVAVSNPKLAPYGVAAYEVLDSLHLMDLVKPKMVVGDNIGKTYQFVKSSNAQVGFVALSQCWKNGEFTSGSGWIIPQDLYTPIRQNAILLNHGSDNSAARNFLDFMKTNPEALRIKEAYGYASGI